ncbi:MAG: ShlB/FhaC/HecB family hemolysin secretion/activation protein [Cyanothece sp. SIO2G6]|nr:ShlB/FhaC/HecB family hemolysin secretion/activation protein [Cyanothece sp. SIO2G6]
MSQGVSQKAMAQFVAQFTPSPDASESNPIPPEFTIPDFGTDPDQLPPPDLLPLPLIEDLLRPSDLSPPVQEDATVDELRVTVNRIEFEGNTVFSDEELNTVIPDGILGEAVTITQLYDIRTAVTAKYLDAGYATSGAFLPEQPIRDGMVTIQVVEGTLTRIDIRGNEKLQDSYVANRIRRDIDEDTPLNVNDLLDTLRLLQLDPRIETLAAELGGGINLGDSILTVDVVEGDAFDVVFSLDNGRSPSVGSFRQSVELRTLNFNGHGETFSFAYSRTRGSNAFDGRISTFLNARDGKLELRGGISDSQVVEEPFDESIELESQAHFVELTYRQPIVQTLNEEFALGITASHQQNRSTLTFLGVPEGFGGSNPFTIFGADEDGIVRVSALRFFQEWNRRRSRDVFAARSQLSIGLDAFDSTVNSDGRPDSRFVAWRGQAQWARLLAEDTLLLLKTDVQFADNDLLTLEQFGLGGQSSIRGYRQDILLTDNGVLGSAEFRYPLARVRRVNGVLHLIPFLDVGHGWNLGDDDPDPQTLVGAGLALQWQQNDLTARIDVGFPLVDVDTRDDDSLQEMGIHLSLEWTAF